MGCLAAFRWRRYGAFCGGLRGPCGWLFPGVVRAGCGGFFPLAATDPFLDVLPELAGGHRFREPGADPVAASHDENTLKLTLTSFAFWFMNRAYPLPRGD